MSGSWIGAAEAARALHISRATLYAYVSRGYLRSQSMPGSTRERGYSRDDVERLRRRTEERRNPDKAAAHALQWGMPILESSIALIDGAHLYYRGHDAIVLARERSLAEVASLVWTGRFDTPFVRVGSERSLERGGRTGDGGLSFVARAQRALARTAASDPRAFDLRPEAVARCGWRILHLLTHLAARSAPRTGRRSTSRWRDRGSFAAAPISCGQRSSSVPTTNSTSPPSRRGALPQQVRIRMPSSLPDSPRSKGRGTAAPAPASNRCWRRFGGRAICDMPLTRGCGAARRSRVSGTRCIRMATLERRP